MKRSLALVLALVMAFGMMVIPASADFSDSSKIEYTEAVDVMTAIGVINGFEDGSFDPAGTLTREQAAKVIAYMMLDAKSADALKATADPFKDVAANRWSAGYIAYAVTEGMVSGRGDGNFDPTGKLTGYEFAKLLLTALGYDASIEGFTGASWAVNVAKTALNIDLFDGNEGANYNAPITREEAALYAFNALTSDVVDYASRGTNIKLPDGTVVNTGASKAESVKLSASADHYNKGVAKDGVLQFCERYFKDLVLTASDSDAFDRPANQWRYKTKTVGTYAAEPVLTYTVGTKGSEIYADLGKPVSGTVYTYAVDGKAYAATAIGGADPVPGITDVYTGFAIAAGTAGDKKIGGNGALVEVFEDGDNYKVTVVNTYVGILSSWKAATSSADEYVTVDGTTVIPGSTLTGGGKFETTAFTEDDADDEMVVLYTAAQTSGADYEIKSVVEAESVSAYVTRSSNDNFVAGGTTYKYSVKHDTDMKASYVKDADDAVIYLDSYGYAIYVDADASSSTTYAYVVDAATEDKTWSSGNDKYLAKIVLDSGEVVTVEVKDDADDLIGKVVSYKVSKKDVYTLTDETDKSVSSASNFELKKNVSRITLASGNTMNANSKTIFIVAKGDDIDDMDYTVYTGIASVPSMEGADKVVAAIDSGYAKYVYIENSSASAKADDVAYIVYDAKKGVDVFQGEDSDDYVVFNAIVDGKSGTIKVAYVAPTYAPGDDDKENPIYDTTTAYGKIMDAAENLIAERVTYDSDGLATKLGNVVDVDTSEYYYTETYRPSNGTILIDDEAYTIADGCKVFRIENDGDIVDRTVSSIRDVSDDIYVVVNDDDLVTMIFLIQD